jgi:hypothetical protein
MPVNADEKGKVTLSWRNWRGKEYSVVVNMVADAREVVGLAGYPWLIIAANPHLSNANIEDYLSACGIYGVERPLSWIQRKRGMFRRSSQANRSGPIPDRDHVRALLFMRDNPKFSARQMARELKHCGIERSREWVRVHRCGPLPQDAILSGK